MVISRDLDSSLAVLLMNRCWSLMLSIRRRLATRARDASLRWTTVLAVP